MNTSPESWRRKAVSGVVLVLLVAGGARLAYELAAPLVPAAVVILFLLGLYGLLVGRGRR